MCVTSCYNYKVVVSYLSVMVHVLHGCMVTCMDIQRLYKCVWSMNVTLNSTVHSHGGTRMRMHMHKIYIITNHINQWADS